MLTEKYEFDEAALDSLLKAFVIRKYNITTSAEIKVTVQYTSGHVSSMTVIVKRSAEAEAPNNSTILQDMSNDRNIALSL